MTDLSRSDRSAEPPRCTRLVRQGNIAIPCGQVIIGQTCPIHGIVTPPKPVGADEGEHTLRGRSVS